MIEHLVRAPSIRLCRAAPRSAAGVAAGSACGLRLPFRRRSLVASSRQFKWPANRTNSNVGGRFVGIDFDLRRIFSGIAKIASPSASVFLRFFFLRMAGFG